MNLKQAIEQVKEIPGFVTFRKRAEDHNGMVQCFTFWFERDGVLKDYEVRFLVQFLGDPQKEKAQCYGTQHIVQATPFRDEVASALSKFTASHSEYIAGAIVNSNEAAEMAVVSAFKVDSQDLAQQVQAVVCRRDGKLAMKWLKAGG